MSEFTIGGFAEDLISKELGKIKEDPSYIAEAVSSELPQGDVPDLRNVEIPNNFMNELLGESTQEEEEPKKVEQPSEDLFGKLHSLVRELDTVLNEMTMSGHIGTNQAGKGVKPKAISRDSFGYIPVSKSNKEAKTFLRKLNRLSGTKRNKDDGRDFGENEPGMADDPARKVGTRRRRIKNK